MLIGFILAFMMAIIEATVVNDAPATQLREFLDFFLPIRQYYSASFSCVNIWHISFSIQIRTLPNGGSLSSIFVPPLGTCAFQSGIMFAFSADRSRLISSETFGHPMGGNFQQQSIVDLRQLEDRLAGQREFLGSELD